MRNEKSRPERAALIVLRKVSGDVLLSHQVALAVPSALEGLTSGFGMGPGVAPPLWPPKRLLPKRIRDTGGGASLEQSPRNR
jgi:hypothetical protein